MLCLHGTDMLPTEEGDEARLSTQPGDAMAPPPDPFPVQQLPHLLRPIGFACMLVQHAHPLDERMVRLASPTRRSPTPAIEAAPTYLQHPTHARQSNLVLMSLHERVLHRDSLAKYVAAFSYISRSSVTRASSRFSRVISVWSSTSIVMAGCSTPV